jgi:VPDSG-CTERM motif
MLWQGSCFLIIYKKTSPPQIGETNTNNMNKMKYALIIGVLCAGMTSLAHATLSGPTLVNLSNNSQAGELAAFQEVSGHSDAQMCVVQSPGNETITNSFGTFTFTNLPFNPVTGHYEVQVAFTMNPGSVVCGFITKNGHGNGVFVYTVSEDQGSSGTFTLEVPFTGALSHIDVFCCAGGVTTPDGGTTVMLLGAALGALGMARRYIMS